MCVNAKPITTIVICVAGMEDDECHEDGDKMEIKGGWNRYQGKMEVMTRNRGRP